MLDLLERLKESSIGKKLEADFETETLRKRKAAAAEIKHITAEESKVLPGLLEARERAEGGVKAAQEAVQKAKEAYDRAAGDVWNITVRATGERQQQEIILRGSYPKEIDAFKTEMNKLLDLMRSEPIQTQGERGYGGGWVGKIYSNREAVHARLKYLRDAIREMEQVKLEALEPEKLTARLHEIRRKMPQTGVMQLIS